MPERSTSLKIYLGLIVILAVLAAISIFLPAFPGMIPSQDLPAPVIAVALANAGIMIILYGGLGFLGLKLSQKIGFTDICDAGISNRQRFLIPALIGIGNGIFFILADIILSRFHSFGPLPHPEFPLSIIASLTAGISEEILFRLFFISFWVWLISYVILRGKWQNRIFWIIAVLSALAFAIGHFPSFMIINNLKTVTEIPPALITEIILLNGVLSLFTAYYLRKFGFLAAVGIHFWADVVWHVIWGVF